MSAKKKSAKQNKLWYRKPWGVALLVMSVITLTFPIPLAVIMWQKNKFNTPVRVAITAVICLIYGPAVASFGDRSETKTAESSQQQAETVEQKQAKQKQLEEKTAAEYQEVVDTLAPIYCSNHQDITVNEPDLQKDGWPMADNQKGITQDECKILIGLLYIQRAADSHERKRAYIESVAERKVAIGMTKIEVVYAWGSPGDINKTVTAGGTHEQWVFGSPIYGGNYVYLDNGIVTSVQS